MFVELIVNNDYRGLYVLIEKIKKSKLGLPKCDTICKKSFMVKIDKPKEGWWEKGCFRLKNNEYVTEDGDRDLHYYFMTVCPKYKVGKECAFKIYSIFDTISILIARKQFEEIREKWLDYKTMVDFSILNEFSKNVDAYRISSYFHKLPMSKVRAGPPWDYNFSYGIIDIEGGLDTKGFMFDNHITFFWWRHLFHYDKVFAKMYANRWWTLRENILSNTEIEKNINLVYNKIKDAANRDCIKWSHKNFESSILELKGWMFKRTKWIDETIKNISK